ncbi:MAG TPA: hypothetical protein VNK67_00460 [Burkholderiales bacterium]|nr:hypothetical protein [Burkholderiales bacterium]
MSRRDSSWCAAKAALGSRGALACLLLGLRHALERPLEILLGCGAHCSISPGVERR